MPDVVKRLAPIARFHSEETRFPMAAYEFIANSDLYWKHDGACSDYTIDTTPYGPSLAGTYTHRATDAWCDHYGGV